MIKMYNNMNIYKYHWKTTTLLYIEQNKMTYLSVCNPIRKPGWPMRFPTCPTKIPRSSSKPVTGTALLLPTESRNPGCHACAEMLRRCWCNRQSDEVTICTRDPVDVCVLASIPDKLCTKNMSKIITSYPPLQVPDLIQTYVQLHRSYTHTFQTVYP